MSLSAGTDITGRLDGIAPSLYRSVGATHGRVLTMAMLHRSRGHSREHRCL
jgi:hypothetical protein